MLRGLGGGGAGVGGVGARSVRWGEGWGKECHFSLMELGEQE